MQTSRFQLGLIAALVMGLGLALSSSPAIGYPAGAAVSFGANPLWAYGGSDNATSKTVFTAPSDTDMVLTDLSLSTDRVYSSRAGLKVGSTVVGEWVISGKSSTQYSGTTVNLTMTSGIRIPAGQTLKLTTDGSYISYAMSGYHAHP